MNRFNLAPDGKHPPRSRSIKTREGIGDRLRSAAFAEIQARDAFLWAEKKFSESPVELKKAWKHLAREEDKHLNWLLTRLQELGIGVADRPVSGRLWKSFVACQTAEEFAHRMATAEDRGRQAGERFFESLRSIDLTTAKIFKTIAEEEVSHIRLAEKFFPLRQDFSISEVSSAGDRTF